MKSLKRWFSNRLMIAVFSFGLGVLSLWAAQSVWSLAQEHRQRPPEVAQAEEFYDRFFKEDDDFFGSSKDPFAQMQEMHKQMMEHYGGFQRDPLLFGGIAKDLHFADSNSGIQKREDDRYVYYEISVEGEAQKKLEVKVEDGQILLSGEVEKKLQDGNQESIYTSNFHRSLPVPENTDPAKVEVRNDQGKIVLKFPKV